MRADCCCELCLGLFEREGLDRIITINKGRLLTIELGDSTLGSADRRLITRVD